MSHERDHTPEDLLEWCLDPRSKSEASERALREDPELRARMEDLESTVARLRGALACENDASAVIAGVLARTTREDLSWRGDLRLVRDHVIARLTSSWALRIVAASLVIHLSALPILGFMLLREREERHIDLRLEKPVEAPYEEALPEPEREVESPDPALRPRGEGEDAR